MAAWFLSEKNHCELEEITGSAKRKISVDKKKILHLKIEGNDVSIWRLK